MKNVILVAALGGILSIGPANAAASSYCSEPRAPSMYISKPSKPYCASSRSCSSWEVSSYKSSVERYYQELEDYADGVNRYVRQANDYIECMSDLD